MKIEIRRTKRLAGRDVAAVSIATVLTNVALALAFSGAKMAATKRSEPRVAQHIGEHILEQIRRSRGGAQGNQESPSEGMDYRGWRP